MKALGTVYLVGAGPGDPGLITVKGDTLLRRAGAVVVDRLVAGRLLRACAPSAKIIYAGKEGGGASTPQASINRLLVKLARKHETVVRLKGGDPFLFGRGGEEALALRQAGVACEIVPGVTSAIAVPAYAGIPVTDRRMASSLAVVTGHEDPEKKESALDWPRLATATDTLVCLMGLSTLPRLVGRLTEHGRPAQTPAAVIQWGTTAAQRTIDGTLKSIVAAVAKAKIKAPAILVVGNVVRLRGKLAWFEKRPLFGQRILVTRASDKAAGLAGMLEDQGASVELLPAITLEPVKATGIFREALNAIPRTHWVFFTSPEGIGWFAKALKAGRKDLRILAGCYIGAIGIKTAQAIESFGVHVDFVPRAFSQEGMLRDFPKRVLKGKRALIFSALNSRDVLDAGLKKHGMHVKKVPIYQTAPPKQMNGLVPELFAQPFDLVTATSASCVEHLYAALESTGRRRLFGSLRFATIGPVTSQAVRKRGGRVMVEAPVATIEGLAEALIRYSRKRKTA